MVAAAALPLLAAAAAAEVKTMPQTTRFCPSWAEAHERTLASLNGGVALYRSAWKGCIVLRKGQKANVVSADGDGTEIVVKGRRWFADDPLF